MFLRQRAFGHALISACYRLPNDEKNDLIPDLSFVTTGREPFVSSGPAPDMPHLAVEAQSEGQTDKFMTDKACMVWIIYPPRRLVEVLFVTERHGYSDGWRRVVWIQRARARSVPA